MKSPIYSYPIALIFLAVVGLTSCEKKSIDNNGNGTAEFSISLPDEDTNCKTLAQVVPKKTTPALFYCNGIKCGRSVRAVRIALKCGYKDVYWFRGGFEEWTEKQYLFEK